jgi:hypothetical protein
MGMSSRRCVECSERLGAAFGFAPEALIAGARSHLRDEMMTLALRRSIFLLFIA